MSTEVQEQAVPADAEVTETRQPVIHNHKPNFGRYVDGCPKCAEKHPDGKPAPPPKTAPEPPVESTGMVSQEALIEAMRVLGSELRRPDPEVEADKAAHKMRMQLAKENEQKVVLEALQQKRASQAYCESRGHRMDNGMGRIAISGQVHSDGMFHPICPICQKEFTPYKPTPDQMGMGVM